MAENPWVGDELSVTAIEAGVSLGPGEGFRADASGVIAVAVGAGGVAPLRPAATEPLHKRQ